MTNGMGIWGNLGGKNFPPHVAMGHKQTLHCNTKVLSDLRGKNERGGKDYSTPVSVMPFTTASRDCCWAALRSDKVMMVSVTT